ncbi:MAG: aminomethyl-transferring glycine dehydrogenase subunit GcvPB [Euryarchaeota archaeon]|nr:aminomethyl-transferring glycine dehydrogenase subunit GcvPB [Euryarchaeota archaeon]MDE1836328.1 aminomethyl-transferring glycine dehydrogenase subunit GcvPB [Euryarchaeota archaeon]MDE1879126.1 aminomethyl-transferring glycine dehydrogenase subunit GcvPB [Euryarchaeota archaeon]MDE2044276.1 aminomethyl-transferring glycine dehydrogenase subunit GcvPB [Thermoplasmata archaeon]
MSFRQARWEEPLLWEVREPKAGTPSSEATARLPEAVRRRKGFRWPELSELEVARHFTRLSQMNFGIETSFYPLGSCTMKYNPRVSEVLARRPEIADVHPYQPEGTAQGLLAMLWELEQGLGRITGLPNVSLQIAAGAHGEYVALRMTAAYHRDHGGGARDQVLLPDTAHGTNPASAAMAGFTTREIPSKNGCVDLAALEAALSERTAAFMLTNPNTAGLFEEQILEIADRVHKAGAILYYDGANLNAVLGKTGPGKMGFDVAHLNLHKTFATPHGGGGPGDGALCVGERLKDYLPVPRIVKNGRKFHLSYDFPRSIGKVKTAYGNVGLDLRAFVFMKAHGEEGLRRVSERAVLNSNYLAHRLGKHLPRPFKPLVKHEFLLSGAPLRERGVRTLDLAKRLLDEGVHAPTIYFPSLVEESLMIEPPETESKRDLDQFFEAFLRALQDSPERLHAAPMNLAVRRVDEVKAARDLLLSWRDLERVGKLAGSPDPSPSVSGTAKPSPLPAK